MKKLLFAVSALAALSLLVPSTGMAEATNVLGLYTDGTAADNTISGAAPFSTHDVYLVIKNPYNPDADAPVQFLGGIEYALIKEGCLVLNTLWPVNVTDVGSGDNVIAGFGEPLAVTDGLATVATLSVLYQSATGQDAAFMTLAPAEPASIPGAMACLDSGNPGDIVALTPPYENFEYPVFAINAEIATQPSTMDGVKALFR